MEILTQAAVVASLLGECLFSNSGLWPSRPQVLAVLWQWPGDISSLFPGPLCPEAVGSLRVEQERETMGEGRVMEDTAPLQPHVEVPSVTLCCIPLASLGPAWGLWEEELQQSLSLGR